MIRKIIWTLCSAIGTSALLFTTGCGKETTEPPFRSATYIYSNKLEEKVYLQVYGGGNYNSRSIESGDSTTYLSKNEAVFPFTYGSDIPGGVADSVIIKIAGNRCVVYKNFGPLESEQLKSGGVFNLQNYDNYSERLVSQKAYTLKYSIDSLDYKKSQLCK